MEMRLIAAGTSPEQRSQGIAAARRVFELSRLDPVRAQLSYFHVEDSRQLPGFDRTLPPAMERAAGIWKDAVAAAAVACYGLPPARASVRLIVES